MQKRVGAGREEVGGTQSIRRALRILREFTTGDSQGLRVRDLCERLDIRRPTIHRILASLAQEGMVIHSPATRRYRLGPAAFQLGLAASSHFTLRDICDPALERLAIQTEDTVYLTERSGNDSVVIERKLGRFPVKAMTLEIGARRPLGVGAGGLAIISALPPEEASEITAANAHRLSGHSDLDAQKLEAMVANARSRGYALDVGHAFPDVTGVGLPILSSSGSPVAAISISAIRTRMTEVRVAMAVMLLRDSVQKVLKDPL